MRGGEGSHQASATLDQLPGVVAGGGRHTFTGSISRRRSGREPPDLAPDQAGPSAPTYIIAVKPPDLDITKKRYPVVIPYVKGVSDDERIRVKSVL